MHWRFEDFVTEHGRNRIHDWLGDVPKRAKAAINVQIGLLALGERLGRPDVGHLHRPPCSGLVELRLTVDKALYRPLGVIRGDRVILLMGAMERGNRFDPPDACQTARERLNLLDTGRATTCEHDIT